jgi:hypothetical protein
VLEGIAARSANDIWAVGWAYDHNHNDAFRPMTLHWDGICWSEVWCPTLGSEAQLFAVTYLPQGDAFAVGRYVDPQLGLNLTFAILWDHNFNVWTISPTPNVPNADNFLFGVSGTSRKDVWAVGHAEDPQWQNLALHWDGANWTIAQTPNPGGPQAANTLNSVAAISPDNVWAAGMGNGNQTLIERWDGQQWGVFPSPNAADTAMFGWNALLGIAVGGPVDIWSVGEYIPNQIARECLVLHGDFQMWNVYPHPVVQGAQPKDQHSLRGVSVDPVGGAWAVGSNVVDVNNVNVYKTLIVYRAPGSLLWSVLHDQPNGSANGLSGVAAVADNDVWVAGWYHDPNLVYPLCLFEHWDGNHWKTFP